MLIYVLSLRGMCKGIDVDHDSVCAARDHRSLAGEWPSTLPQMTVT